MIDVTDIQTFPSDARLASVAAENIKLVRENKIISNFCGALFSIALVILIKYKKLKKQTDGAK